MNKYAQSAGAQDDVENQKKDSAGIAATRSTVNCVGRVKSPLLAPAPDFAFHAAIQALASSAFVEAVPDAGLMDLLRGFWTGRRFLEVVVVFRTPVVLVGKEILLNIVTVAENDFLDAIQS